MLIFVKKILPLLLLLIFLTSSARAQDQNPPSDLVIKLDTGLVELDTLILDKKTGRPVVGIKADDLELYEDNIKRFRAGRISANDLILDQNRVFDSELLAIEGWGDLHLNLSKFCHSIGMLVSECLFIKSEASH